MLLYAPLSSTCVFLHWGIYETELLVKWCHTRNIPVVIWKHFKLMDLPGPTEPPHRVGSLWLMGCIFICSFIKWFLIGCFFTACMLFVRLRNHLRPPKQKLRSEQKLRLNELVEEFPLTKGGRKETGQRRCIWNGSNIRKLSVFTFDDSQSEIRLDGCCFTTCNSLMK